MPAARGGVSGGSFIRAGYTGNDDIAKMRRCAIEGGKTFRVVSVGCGDWCMSDSRIIQGL